MLEPVLIPSVKQLAPPTPTSSGGGDVTVSQRVAEKQALFKTPTRILQGKSRIGRSGSSSDLTERGRPKKDTPRPGKRCKSAVSLDESRPRREDAHRLLSQRKRPPVRQTATMSQKSCTPQQSLEKLAGRRVCQLLVLNAWRKQKQATALLKETADVLNEKLSGLKRQAVTLRTLLNDEKERVAATFDEFQKMAQLVRESFEDRDNLMKQKEGLETMIAGLEKKLHLMRERCENFKNAFLDAKSQWNALDAILLKEHDKLARLAVEKQELLDKIEEHEESEVVKQGLIDVLNRKTTAMEAKLKIQENLYEATMAENRRVNDQIAGLESESASLQLRADEVTSQHDLLMTQIDALERQLKERDEERARLDATLGTKFVEITSLTDRIAEQTRLLQTTWVDRARDAVTCVARLPFHLLSMVFRARQPGLTS